MRKDVNVRVADGLLIDGNPLELTWLSVGCEPVEVWSRGPRPDRRWSHVDEAGHFHAWSDREDHYPTLLASTERHPCPGDCGDPGCEGADVTTYACRACGEPVVPGTAGGPYREVVEGPESWSCAVRGRLPLGDAVSVVVRLGAEVHFGLAFVASSRQTGPYGAESPWESVLVGTTALGRRSA